jgi:exonuclease SbcD
MPEFKIFHTSDWHLGKKLFKADRIEEHTQFLEWTYQFLISEKINLLIIAGDVFDVPNPPNVAQQLFYDFIFKIGKIPNFQSIVITGNHDSSSLFEIPKSFFQKHNCHIYTKLENDLSKLEHYIEYNLEIMNSLIFYPKLQRKMTLVWKTTLKTSSNNGSENLTTNFLFPTTALVNTAPQEVSTPYFFQAWIISQ